MSLDITNELSLPSKEIEITAIRSQGAGGQNVNKVASAIHLRFDIHGSSLSDLYKERLIHLRDHRITSEGILVIKAQEFRSQDKNRAEALARLKILIKSVMITPKNRRPTKPSRNSKIKRLENKAHKRKVKSLRGRVDF